ncbi:MAG: type II toxin-antitoxin system VapB family antitoxin [Acidobacteria bacterium]|nr:type II toxin-antitoxin system VapB family antitoxin [Acidobacteriota bacterium]MBI3473118.1 type II toxin-antitoxin system VapB family antitoxin [Candidatus Solibacter usitatus]
MSLNLKNEETHRLAREVAQRTGQSLTGAITEALREKLDRLGNPRGVEALASDLLAIGADCARRLKEPYRSKDHGELLYDKRGLPG